MAETGDGDGDGDGVAVLSSFLTVAFDTMATPAYQNFFERREFSYELIKDLKTKMIALSSIVDAAEEKQFIRDKVRIWLLELKDTAYEVEDLLDGIQIEYQAHQSKAVNEDHSQDPLKKDLEPKLQQICEKLRELKEESDGFGLKKAGEGDGSPEKTETTPPPARPESFQYDVFLNFRGEDVRYGFLYNLKEALQEQGIKPFYDAEDLRKGEEIDKILEKIKASKMSVMIFSKDYVSSSYCLEELVTILACKAWGHKAVPVFYHVSTDDVANPSGSYAKALEALEKHENEKGTNSNKFSTWRVSLKEASAISGFVIENKRPEKYHIRDIVEEVIKIKKDFDKEENCDGLSSAQSQ